MDASKETSKFFLYTVVGLGAAYLLYQLLQQLGGAAGSAVANLTNAPVTALANWYVQLTSSGQAIPQGMVLLPSGSAIPLASLAVTSTPNPSSPAGISGMFAYQGTTYFLNSSHDSNGNYAASTTLSYP